MIEKIQAKIERIIERIIAKPDDEITKEDFDILACEYGKLKAEIDSKENARRMAEMVANTFSR